MPTRSPVLSPVNYSARMTDRMKLYLMLSHPSLPFFPRLFNEHLQVPILYISLCLALGSLCEKPNSLPTRACHLY